MENLQLELDQNLHVAEGILATEIDTSLFEKKADGLVNKNVRDGGKRRRLFAKDDVDDEENQAKNKNDNYPPSPEGTKNVKKSDGIINSSRQDDPTIEPSESSTSALELMMLPPELLHIIVDNLSLPHLKPLRLVNIFFNGMATRRIIKLGIGWISFRYDVLSKLFVQATRLIPIGDPAPRNINKVSTLSDFIDCLKYSSNNLPFHHFGFYGGDLGTDDPQSFFSFHGPKIDKLIVSWRGGWTKQNTFMDILSRLSPNVRHLELDGINMVVRPFQEPSQTVTKLILPKLKYIKSINKWSFINDNPQFVSELLTVSPNLQNYDSWFRSTDLHHVDIFVLSNKICAIKKFACDIDVSSIDSFEKFANAAPEIEQMTFSFEKIRRQHFTSLVQRVTAGLSKILESSKDTLTTVHFFSPIGFLWDLKWPEMRSVKSLCFHIHEIHDAGQEASNCLFPWGIDRIFPALKNVRIKCSSALPPQSFYQQNFPFKENLSSVQTLILRSGTIPLVWLDRLPSVFVSVCELEMSKIEDLPNVTKFMYQFPMVKKLKLQIKVCEEHTKNTFPSLDALLTGFSHQTCKELTEDCEREALDLETLRVNPSILNLKELKILTISLQDVDVRLKESYNLLSGHLSGRCAFQLMPGLVVRVYAKTKFFNIRQMNESLRSIAPYVKEAKTWSL